MIIKGKGLHVKLLDLAQGKVVISGTVDSLAYIKVKDKSGKSFLARLMK